MKQAIERSRALQIERKKKQKADDLQDERDFSEFWKVRNQELQLAEQQEREEEKQRNLELVKFLQRQADEKLEKSKNMFREDNKNAVEA